jgi:hypothetical protein
VHGILDQIFSRYTLAAVPLKRAFFSSAE